MDNSMTFEEKLSLIDKEIRLLHKFCLDSGYSPQQVEDFAKPFFRSRKSVERRKVISTAVSLAVLIAVFAAVLNVDPAYKIVRGIARKASIAVLPVWNWADIYSWQCILENPLYNNSVTEDECRSACSGLTQIDSLTNVSQDIIAKDYIQKDIPVMVTDGMRDWPDSIRELSIQKLLRTFSNHHILKNEDVCSLTKSGKGEGRSLQEILTEAATKTKTDYFIHWENCERNAAKAFRKLHFRRPYFLPQLVEIITNNFVLLSDNYSDKRMIKIPATTKLVILIQMKGQTRVKLTPNIVCRNICQPIKVEVQQGHMLVVPSAEAESIYEIMYLPTGPESVMMGFLGEYD